MPNRAKALIKAIREYLTAEVLDRSKDEAGRESGRSPSRSMAETSIDRSAGPLHQSVSDSRSHVRNLTPRAVGIYCQYPEPSLINDFGSVDQNFKAEVQSPYRFKCVWASRSARLVQFCSAGASKAGERGGSCTLQWNTVLRNRSRRSKLLNVRKEEIVYKRDLGQSPSFKDRGELLAILFEMEVIENPRPSRATNPAPEFRIIDQCR
jgi:hypothetical protein